MKFAATFLLGACLTFGGVSIGRGQAETPMPSAAAPAADAKVYGEYPTNYQEIITNWLATVLVDPPSAVVDWTDVPKPGEYKTKQGEVFTGYVVEFKVKSRNVFGGVTPKQRYRVVIRDGAVVWGGQPRN